MNTILEEIKQSLQQQTLKLDGRANELKRELKEVEEGRKRFRAALAALGAKATRNQQKKETCTREYVASVVQAVLSENEKVPRADLQELVRGTIADEGKSLIGFGLRMKEVLRSGVVDEVEPNTFALAVNKP